MARFLGRGLWGEGRRGAKSVDPEVLIQLGEGFNSRESSDVYLDSPKVKTSDGLITEGWWGGGASLQWRPLVDRFSSVPLMCKRQQDEQLQQLDSGNTLILHRFSLAEDGETCHVSCETARVDSTTGTETNLVNYARVYLHLGASELLGPERALPNPNIPNQLSIHGLRQNPSPFPNTQRILANSVQRADALEGRPSLCLRGQFFVFFAAVRETGGGIPASRPGRKRSRCARLCPTAVRDSRPRAVPSPVNTLISSDVAMSRLAQWKAGARTAAAAELHIVSSSPTSSLSAAALDSVFFFFFQIRTEKKEKKKKTTDTRDLNCYLAAARNSTSRNIR